MLLIICLGICSTSIFPYISFGFWISLSTGSRFSTYFQFKDLPSFSQFRNTLYWFYVLFWMLPYFSLYSPHISLKYQCTIRVYPCSLFHSTLPCYIWSLWIITFSLVLTFHFICAIDFQSSSLIPNFCWIYIWLLIKDESQVNWLG